METVVDEVNKKQKYLLEKYGGLGMDLSEIYKTEGMTEEDKKLYDYVNEKLVA